MRQTVMFGKDHCLIENRGSWHEQRKKMAKYLNVLHKLGRRQFAPFTPAAQLLPKFAENLPGQHGCIFCNMQVLQ